MKLTNLRTNQLRNPLGFPVSSVSLSFQVEESTGKTLKEAQIRISDQADMSHIVYDSGISEEISSLGFVPDCQLEGGKRYYWTVWAKADDGDCGISEPAWFEGGRKEPVWDVEWITSPFDRETHPVMIKEFTLSAGADGHSAAASIASARLYISGLGVYEAYLNGKKVGEESKNSFFYYKAVND